MEPGHTGSKLFATQFAVTVAVQVLEDLLRAEGFSGRSIGAARVMVLLGTALPGVTVGVGTLGEAFVGPRSMLASLHGPRRRLRSVAETVVTTGPRWWSLTEGLVLHPRRRALAVPRGHLLADPGGRALAVRSLVLASPRRGGVTLHLRANPRRRPLAIVAIAGFGGLAPMVPRGHLRTLPGRRTFTARHAWPLGTMRPAVHALRTPGSKGRVCTALRQRTLAVLGRGALVFVGRGAWAAFGRRTARLLGHRTAFGPWAARLVGLRTSTPALGMLGDRTTGRAFGFGPLRPLVFSGSRGGIRSAGPHRTALEHLAELRGGRLEFPAVQLLVVVLVSLLHQGRCPFSEPRRQFVGYEKTVLVGVEALKEHFRGWGA